MASNYFPNSVEPLPKKSRTLPDLILPWVAYDQVPGLEKVGDNEGVANWFNGIANATTVKQNVLSPYKLPSI